MLTTLDKTLKVLRPSAQEFLFRGIQKGEWTNLFQFISVKGLPVANLAEAERGPGGGARTLDLDLGDDVDTGAVLCV